MKRKGFVLFFFLVWINCNSQELLEGQKLWSNDNKLTVNDYKLKKHDVYNELIVSQFLISHQVNGFDFFKKNFNNRVLNIFVGNASWIDINNISNINKQLAFQQLQFDLAEICTRHFRKRLLLNKRKIAKGFTVVNKISNEIIAEFSSRRLKLVNETKGGKDEKKVKEWREKIKKELEDLNEFRFENKKRIKLK
ncbi:hypothetical protein [uncultured Tenacibaculum sp.]|uniref:hypothetical protein n=1 Tax=uncultured Tenacibaculum sp. TaxID=174713 RepID=UPI00262A1AAA|nr:hypothetical protein [uncultured Tenacibaculum sp.]